MRVCSRNMPARSGGHSASKACLSLTGDSTAGIVAALFLTFAILVAVSYLVYRVCSVCCPRLGMALSGGRS